MIPFLNINNYIVNYEICKECGGEFIPVEHQGLIICNKCGVQKQYLIENEKPSYKEPPKEVCFYAYKRINHFREILAQFQAKETTQIPQEVLDNIKNQIKKERIELKHITNKKAKDILKKLGYNKYYEHIPFIKDKLGIKPPVMLPELEETLCNLFMEIQKPYSSHCPDDRVNFLNYYYVLYKMCELLDEREFLPYFPMLKDPVKRIEQDEIWKKYVKNYIGNLYQPYKNYNIMNIYMEKHLLHPKHPKFEPNKWNKKYIKHSHNCYAYAMNTINKKFIKTCKNFTKMSKKEKTRKINHLKKKQEKYLILLIF